MQARIIFVVVSFAISVFAVPVAVPAPEALGVSAAIENQPVVSASAVAFH